MKSILNSIIISTLIPLSLSAVETVSLTIYNQNFGVVREQIELWLEPGEQVVDLHNFNKISRTMVPSSIILRSIDGSSLPFRLLEQSYRAELIDEQQALSLFEGQVLNFERPSGTGIESEVIQGRVIRAGSPLGENPIIEVDGLLRFSLPGTPLFPRIHDDNLINPRLTWRIQSLRRQTPVIELCYLTEALHWEADYNFIAPSAGDSMQIIGWVTLTNRSGRSYDNARVSLMAGTANRIRPERAMMMARSLAESGDSFSTHNEALDSFYLYNIAQPTTLRDQQPKQIEFLRTKPFTVSRRYIIGSTASPQRLQEPLFQSNLRATTQRLPVQSFVRFENTEANGLGLPIPAGKARFYRAASDGSLHFIGENQIAHTPRNELVELRLNEAFDWVAERTQLSFERNESQRWMTETIRIVVRNQSNQDGRVEILENLFRWRSWQIRSSTIEAETVDSQTIRFPLSVPARAESTITYTVEYTW
jgi:hypothetical protein